MGKRRFGKENKTRDWHRWHMILIAVALCVGCGGLTTGGSGGGLGGTSGAAAPPPCPACAPDSYICSAPGVASATMEITSRSDNGCSGNIQGSGVEMTCDTSTICYAKSCEPFTLEGGALHFSLSGGGAVCSK